MIDLNLSKVLIQLDETKAELRTTRRRFSEAVAEIERLRKELAQVRHENPDNTGEL